VESLWLKVLVCSGGLQLRVRTRSFVLDGFVEVWMFGSDAIKRPNAKPYVTACDDD
jgi:hypothetical protein